jgi:hypothetical protein
MPILLNTSKISAIHTTSFQEISQIINDDDFYELWHGRVLNIDLINNVVQMHRSLHKFNVNIPLFNVLPLVTSNVSNEIFLWISW